ncbi:hypothetical protein OIU77_006597 [Salix suchowensis]|uniref:Uncharacterized protein n=1 Tax=Salix suchowensis TaxID=1278906 RepID=A0ABQ9AN80_9ROSI|nr:hypothetical protein OIU77_006597 [Salix suchowensis]
MSSLLQYPDGVNAPEVQIWNNAAFDNGESEDSLNLKSSWWTQSLESNGSKENLSPVCEESSPVFVNSSNPTKPLQSNTNLVNSLGSNSLKIGVSKTVAKNGEIKNRNEKKIDMEIDEIEREIKRLSSRLEALRLEKVERNISKTIEKRGRIVAAKFMDQKQSVKIEEPLISSAKSKINRRGVSLGPSEILSGSKSRLFCGKQEMNTPGSIQNRRKSCFWKLEEIDELKATKQRGKSLSVSPRSRKNVSKIQVPKQAVTTVGSRRSVKKEDGVIASIQPKNLFKDGEKSAPNKKPLKPGRLVSSRYSQIGTNQPNGNLTASEARKRSLPDNEKEDVNKRRASRGNGACQRMESGRVKKKGEIPSEVVLCKGGAEGESPPTVSIVADVLPKIRTVRCVAETPRDSGEAKRVADLVGKKPYFCTEEAEAGDSVCKALSFAGEDGEEE